MKERANSEMPICTFNDVSFMYEKTSANVFSGTSFTIEAGKIYGLLGPNGAGKTTLMDLLFGHLCPKNGSISWGANVDERFYLRQYITIPEAVTIGDFIEMLFRINRGKFDRAQFLDSLSDPWQSRMHALMDKNAPTVSFGEGKWATTIAALSLPQPFIALDEPTAAMDVPTRQGIWKQLIRRKQKGDTALVSSHYLEEFESNVDAIFAIKDGLIHKFDGVPDFMQTVAPRATSINEAFTTFYEA